MGFKRALDAVCKAGILRSARVAAMLALLAAAFLTAAAGAQAGVPAHSHWDDPNGNYELDFCLVVEKAPQSGTISYIPLREQDAQDYMALHITTNGLTLESRIKGADGSGHSYYDPSPLAAAHTYHNPSAPAHYGVGDEVMVAFVMDGNV